MDRPLAAKYLAHLEGYNVIVCRICRHAIQPQSVADHIKRQHEYLSKKARKEIQQTVTSLTTTVCDIDDVVIPCHVVAPIAELTLHTNAYRCIVKDCGFICTSLSWMKDHAKKEHQWKSCQGRGGNARAKTVEPANKIWRDGVACQRFFSRGNAKGTRYFEVTLPSNQAHLSVRQHAALFKALEAERQELLHSEADDIVQEEMARFSTDIWLKFTTWKMHHRGLKPIQLREMKKLPEAVHKSQAVRLGARHNFTDIHEEGDEPDLDGDFIADCCRAVELLISQAHAVCKESVVGRPALQYISHRNLDGNGKVDQIMYYNITRATLSRNTLAFLHMTTYILRTYRLSSRERPPYVLTKEQVTNLEAIRKFWSEYKEERRGDSMFREGLVSLCHTLWMSLIVRVVGDRPFDSAMLSAVSILGVSSAYNERIHDFYHDAASFSPTIAGVVTTVRMLFLFDAYTTYQNDMAEMRVMRPDLTESYEVEALIDTIKQRTARLTDDHLVWQGQAGSTSTTMYSIQALKHQARSLGAQRMSKGHTYWVNRPEDRSLRGSILNVNSKDLNLTKFSAMLHSCANRLKLRLERDLLLVTDKAPTVDVLELKDNPANCNEIGWNFLSDSRNQKLLQVEGVPGKDWLYWRLVKTPSLQVKFGQVMDDDENEVRWDPDGVKAYLDDVKSFKEQLIVLVHLTAGAPARGNEVLSIQHRNSMDNPDGRHLFVENGLVALAPNWSKTAGHMRKSVPIHRYVPKEVGDLVVRFLWLVQPFVETIQRRYFKQKRLSHYIWEADYGHVALDATGDHQIPIGHNEEDGLEEAALDIDEDDDDDYQRGDDSSDESSDVEDNSTKRGSWIIKRKNRIQARNPDGLYSSDKIRRLMHAEFQRHGLPPIGIQDWRHSYPAIQREIARNNMVSQTLDVIYGNAKPLANFHARASGHSERTEANIYGRDLGEGHLFTSEDRMRFRAVSVDWHIALQFPSTFDGRHPDIGFQTIRQEKARLKEAQNARLESIAESDLCGELRIFTGRPDAEFRPGQEEALRAIVDGTPRLLVIMATGAGKASLFMLPAMHPEAGTTIVVVPTIALRLDLKYRTLPTGLDCMAYDGVDDEIPYGAKVVFVTPEGFCSERFMTYIHTLMSQRILDRIVVDECHVVLDSVDEPGWRPSILELSKKSHALGVQLIYLTGSLCPSDMDRFYGAIGLRKSDMTVLRQSTSRSNIAYSIQPVLIEQGIDDERDRIANYIKTFMHTQPEDHQAIIYTPTINTGQDLANRLNTSMFHGKLQLRKKQKLLTAFKRCEIRIIVATNALGQGVDLGSVRIIFHLAPPEFLRDFVQESGRAARDSSDVGQSIILVKEYRKVGGGTRRVKPAPRTEKAMVEYVTSRDRCRRSILDLAMDGRVRSTGCSDDEQVCDICLGNRRSRTKPVERVDSTRQITGSCKGSLGSEIKSGSIHTPIHDDTSIDDRKPELDKEFGSYIGIDLDLRDVTKLELQSQSFNVRDATTTPNHRLLSSGNIEETYGRQRQTSAETMVKKASRLQPARAAEMQTPVSLKRPMPPLFNAVDQPTPCAIRKGVLQPTIPQSLNETPSKPKRPRVEELDRSKFDRTEIGRLQENMVTQQLHDRRKLAWKESKIIDTIKVWDTHCAICLVVDGTEEAHEWRQCPKDAGRVNQMEAFLQRFYDSAGGFRMESYSACFGCLLPLELCTAQKRTTDEQGKPCIRKIKDQECSYKQCLRVGMSAIAVFGDRITQSWLRREARLTRDGPFSFDELKGWMGRRRRWGSIQHGSQLAYTVLSLDQGFT